MRAAQAGLGAALLAAMASVASAQSGPDRWSDPAGLPAALRAGGSLAAGPGGALYLAPGGASMSFYRYLPATSRWQPAAGVPSVVTTGGSMAVVSSGLLYLISGGGKTAFHEFDPASGSWRILAMLPSPAGDERTVITAAGSRLFAQLHSTNGSTFQEFLPDPLGPGRWVERAQPPEGDELAGLAASADGAYLYALRSGSIEAWRYEVAADRWISSASEPGILAPFPEWVEDKAHLSSAPGGGVYAILADYSEPPLAPFHRYDPGTRRWIRLAEPPMTVSGNGAVVWTGATRALVARGDTIDLWNYSASDDRFLLGIAPAPVVFTPQSASAVTPDGLRLLVIEGGWQNKFWECTLATGAWVRRANYPQIAYTGVSTACVVEGHVYARSFGSPGFSRYSIAGDAWSPMAVSTPVVTLGEYARGAWGGGRRIFVIVDRNSAAFAEYTAPDSGAPSTLGSWALRASLPEGELFGGAACMTYPGSGDFLYVAVGSGRIFRRYSISGNSWQRLADLPVSALGGAALASPGAGNHLYFLRGGGPALWSYHIPSDTWSLRTEAPGTVAVGSGFGPGGDGNTLVAMQGSSPVAWRYQVQNDLPAMETPAQYKEDGTTAIVAGGSTNQSAILARAVVRDDNGHACRLEAEIRAVAEAFTGAATHVGVATAGDGPRTVVLAGLLQGVSYHWRLRAVDAAGGSSPWSAFGGNGDAPPADPDLTVVANRVPVVTEAWQQDADRGVYVRRGGGFFGTRVRLGVDATDPDDDAVRLSIELRPAGEAFTGEATIVGDYGALSFDFERPPGPYRWRYRLEDGLGASAGWTEGGDFSLQTEGSINTKACSGAAGPGLRAWSWIAGAAMWPRRRRTHPRRER